MANSPPPPPRNPKQPKSWLCVKLILILLVACVAAFSVYTNNELISMKKENANERNEIHSLQQQIEAQKTVVARFNNTVTNADIQEQMIVLRNSLKDTEGSLHNEIQIMEASVGEKLDQTVTELDQTVTMAEQNIHAEVKMVQGSVEQYKNQTQDQFSTENDFMKYQLAGTFTLLSALISMWHMTTHLRNFNRPFIQRKILAILWMSPIYSVTSWLSLVFSQYEGYLSIIKDFYEAYVIYQFLSFLIGVLGKGDRDVVVDLLSKHTDHLDPPVRCCGWFRGKYPYGDTPRVLANDILLQCQVFAMQFVFFKPMIAIGLFTCNKLEYYGAGTSPSDYRSPQFWLNIIQNISIFTAFSGLIKFYHAVQDELAWCKPFPKFMTIKGIVFMTFWQGLVISILAKASAETGAISGNDSDVWAKQAQNFLICLEMLVFSIAHFFCFPTEEWEDGYRPSQEKKTKFGDNIALGDFVSDLKLIMGGDRKKRKQLKNIIEDKCDDDETVDEYEGDDDSNVTDNISVDDHSTGGDSFDTKNLKHTIKESLTASDANVREAANRILCTANRIPDDNVRQTMDNVSDEDEESQPNETSSLLGNKKGDNDILRDSVFTAM